MSFRQFPATGNDGNPYIIIEFHDDRNDAEQARDRAAFRYELPDGQRLDRYGHRQFRTPDGTLVLTAST